MSSSLADISLLKAKFQQTETENNKLKADNGKLKTDNANLKADKAKSEATVRKLTASKPNFEQGAAIFSKLPS